MSSMESQPQVTISASFLVYILFEMKDIIILSAWLTNTFTSHQECQEAIDETRAVQEKN